MKTTSEGFIKAVKLAKHAKNSGALDQWEGTRIGGFPNLVAEHDPRPRDDQLNARGKMI